VPAAGRRTRTDPTASADKTATPAPTRAELGKAHRLGWARTPRDELRTRVSQCAATAGDADQFLAELTAEGLDPRTVRNPAGRVVGYTVALPGDRTANGTGVRYAGRTLAADLSWRKLAARWAGTPPVTPLPRTNHGRVAPSERHNTLSEAASAVDRAATFIRNGTEQDVDGIAHATGEILAALSRRREGHDPGSLTELTRRYDRAARTPHQVLPARSGLVAAELRHAARQLGAIGILTGRGQERLATAALLLALAGLVAEIAAWQQLRDRAHQAAAAQATARQLPELARTAAGRRPATGRPPPSVTLPMGITATASHQARRPARYEPAPPAARQH